MQHAQQNDAYSQQQKNACRNFKINPLHLSREQLKERLLTLKNYGMWKRTKARRINCRQLRGDQNSPIINAAASYGYRYGYNEVFAEFVKNEQRRTQASAQDAAQRYKSQDKNNRQQKAGKKNQPSFISYKTDDKEKQKIYKMINHSPKKEREESRKKRSTTQPKMTSQSAINRKASPYPRQLASLKKKLRILPSLHSRNKTEATEFNPEEDNPTISMASNSPQQSQAIRTDFPQKSHSSFQLQHHFEPGANNRLAYLQNIHSILNGSSKLLKGSEGRASNEGEYIRMSSNSYNSALCGSKKSSSPDLKSVEKDRCLAYWPRYAHYGISERDDAKFERILKQCSAISGEGVTQNEDVNQMLAIIREQIAGQQREIDEEVLAEERSAFEHKFDYKISLQREKYKRNMKELLRCKKQYRIEKQREEIRANGIKRMKKMGDAISKIHLSTPNNDQQED